MARFVRKYGPDLAEEIWSDVVVARTPQVVSLFDKKKDVNNKGVEPYFVGTMTWYAHKHVLNKTRREKRFRNTPMDLSTDDGYNNESARLGSRDMLNSLSIELTEFEQWLLDKIAVEGFEHSEIATVCDVSSQTIGRWYRDALAKARTVLEQQEQENVDSHD